MRKEENITVPPPCLKEEEENKQTLYKI